MSHYKSVSEIGIRRAKISF